MNLTKYHAKRRFDRTSEPAGSLGSKRLSGGRFVVQKHAASHLHYDFRLEIDGVLKSWAVPKGPSMNPKEKRLAVQVEDHPLEYAEFEGAIPEGEYGAGSVIVWDEGTWLPLGDGASLQDGKLTFRLRGHVLKGAWSLVRMGNDPRNRNWLLIKHNDSFATTEEVTEQHFKSVASGLALEEIVAHNRALTRRKKSSPGGFGGRS